MAIEFDSRIFKSTTSLVYTDQNVVTRKFNNSFPDFQEFQASQDAANQTWTLLKKSILPQAVVSSHFELVA